MCGTRLERQSLAADFAALDFIMFGATVPAWSGTSIAEVATAHLFGFQGSKFCAPSTLRARLHTIPPTLSVIRMSTLSHTKREKLKLLNRVKRVRGQIEAVERALEEEKGCATVLHLIVTARGAMSSLMTEVIEDHIRLHVVDPVRDSERSRGAEELIEAVQAYLK